MGGNLINHTHETVSMVGTNGAMAANVPSNMAAGSSTASNTQNVSSMTSGQAPSQTPGHVPNASIVVPTSTSTVHPAMPANGATVPAGTQSGLMSSPMAGTISSPMAGTMKMVSANNNAKTKIIKRYQNRKLYDTQQSCYVTLDDIAKMIRTNEDVMVIDNKTKNDITAATLTQIIFEAEKKASAYAPLFTLREIIQNANGSISSYLAKLGAFPKDYAKPEAVVAAATQFEKASFEDMKQSLENRVAKAAVETTDYAAGNKFVDEATPSLPNSNKSLNQ